MIKNGLYGVSLLVKIWNAKSVNTMKLEII